MSSSTSNDSDSSSADAQQQPSSFGGGGGDRHRRYDTSRGTSNAMGGVNLTPEHRRDKVVAAAMYEGLWNGMCTLLPCCGLLHIALQTSPSFRQRTNAQSRTALVIMPALFSFALTSEHKVIHETRSMAKQTQHAHDTVHWAEEEMQKNQLQHGRVSPPSSSSSAQVSNLPPPQPQHLLQGTAAGIDTTAATAEIDTSEMLILTQLYQQSVDQSGVKIVPGNVLQWYHRAANYLVENPFKVVSAFAVPAVAYVFYGQSGKSHMRLSQKIIHTRVVGQSITIGLLLAVMALKDYMDKNGKYITEADANERINEMHTVRTEWMTRLEHQAKIQQEAQDEIRKARLEAATEDGETSSRSTSARTKKKKKKKNPASTTESTSNENDNHDIVSSSDSVSATE